MSEIHSYPDHPELERRNQTTDGQIARLSFQVEGLTHEVHNLRNDIREINDAWKTAKLVVVFIKWLAALGAALVALKFSWTKLWNGGGG